MMVNMVHKKLSSWLKNAINGNINRKALEDIVTDYYLSLNHVSDNTLFLFSEFTDLLEELTLKTSIEYKPQVISYFNKLNDLYHEKIYPLLKDEKSQDNIKISKQLNELYDILESEDLLPSFREFINDLTLNPPKKNIFKEIFEW